MVYLHNLFDGCGNCCGFSFFISSAVQKCIACGVMMNGILFMYMISASSVTFPCLSIISLCSSCNVVITHAFFLCVVLPCSDQRFAPKMSSACRMLALVTGQFEIMFCSMYLIKLY